MSVDLDWHALDAELTQNVITFLENAFATANRPNFVGDVRVTQFSFGDTEPEIELLDVRDVFHEFVEADLAANDPHGHEGDQALVGSARHPYPKPAPPPPRFSSRYFDDVSPIAEDDEVDWASVATSARRRFNVTTNTLLAPPSSALFSPGLNQHRSMGLSPAQTSSIHEAISPVYDEEDHTPPSSLGALAGLDEAEGATTDTTTPSYSSPSLQLHLRVSYSGNLTLGLATSLLINYPSPKFMSLPLQMSVTSIAFSGTFILAFEGDRSRIHLSVLDPLNGVQGLGSANPGSRLLSGAKVESEVGQSDKHVLKNVGKVEKFVLDVLRRTLESELVFP
ncbi:Mitochondrial distribution and morphology protein 12 [Microbotryomycetes sp. JL201]|nr:Mitochondrial distribution and morphology protein 12 [Microbotryomycetes sp. JL201]